MGFSKSAGRLVALFEGNKPHIDRGKLTSWGWDSGFYRKWVFRRVHPNFFARQCAFGEFAKVFCCFPLPFSPTTSYLCLHFKCGTPEFNAHRKSAGVFFFRATNRRNKSVILFARRVVLHAPNCDIALLSCVNNSCPCAESSREGCQGTMIKGPSPGKIWKKLHGLNKVLLWSLPGMAHANLPSLPLPVLGNLVY